MALFYPGSQFDCCLPGHQTLANLKLADLSLADLSLADHLLAVLSLADLILIQQL